MATWPEKLPLPQIQGYGIEPMDQVLRQSFEAGPGRARRRFFSPYERFPVTWIMTHAQMTIFRAWFYSSDGANGGAAWFVTSLDKGFGLEPLEARFAGPWKAVPAGPVRWSVTASLEVRSTPMTAWEYMQALEQTSLDLDFIAGVYSYWDGSFTQAPANPFGSLITYTRNSVATYHGPDGLLKTAVANEPRIDHDPVTLECRGLLIEAPRHNLLTNSGLFSSGAWIKNRCSIVDNAAVSPDGTSNAAKLVEDTTVTNSHVLNRTPYITSTANAVHTVSCYFKAAERSIVSLSLSVSAYTSSVQLRVNLATKTIVGATPGVLGTTSDIAWTIQDVGNGWVRVSLTAKLDAVGTNYNINVGVCDAAGNINYTGDGVSGAYIWGAQLEVGAKASSYIPTTSAAVTREQDRAYITGEAVMRWARPDSGALFAHYTPPAGAISAYVAALLGSNSQNAIRLRYSSGGGLDAAVVASNVVQATNTLSLVLSQNRNYKAATTYAANDFAACLDGGNVVTDPEGTVPSIIQLLIGGFATTEALGGHIRRIQFFPFRMSNARLQELTA